MKNKLFIIIYCGLILFVSTICFAEFYKYKDSNGVQRFTDNLAEVPEDQRPNADKYKEYVPKKSGSNIEQKDAKEAEKKLPGAPPQSKELQIQALGKKIEKIREDLQKDYQQLVAKKKALEALDQKPGPKKAAQIKSLNEQAARLNKDIKAYNQKKETFIDTINEYKRQIRMLSAASTVTP